MKDKLDKSYLLLIDLVNFIILLVADVYLHKSQRHHNLMRLANIT